MEEPASSRSHGTSYVRNEGRHPLAKACDQCHRCKVACNGGRPACDRCEKNDSTCTYSTGKPVGKPKGSKNRSKPEAQRAHVNKANPAPSRQLSGSEGSGKRRMNVGTSPGAHQLDVGKPILAHKFKNILMVYRITKDSDRFLACHLLHSKMTVCRNSSRRRRFRPGFPSHRPMHRSNLNFRPGAPSLHVQRRLQSFSSCNCHRFILRNTRLMLPLTTTSTSRMIGYLIWSTTHPTIPHWIQLYLHWNRRNRHSHLRYHFWMAGRTS